MPTAKNSCEDDREAYSRIRVGVPRGTPVQWRFPQEKATFNGLAKGTVTLILL
jgi:hypothetical protein